MRLERAAVWVAAALLTAWTVRAADAGGLLGGIALPATLAVEAVAALRDAAAPGLGDGLAFHAVAIAVSVLAGGLVVGAWGLCKLAWRGLGRLTAAGAA